MNARLHNRSDAGKRLAARLQRYAGRDDVIVLGLPRGGVPVAFEVARGLGLPLDVFVVRKLSVPGHEELAMGALASGGVRVLNHRRGWPASATFPERPVKGRQSTPVQSKLHAPPRLDKWRVFRSRARPCPHFVRGSGKICRIRVSSQPLPPGGLAPLLRGSWLSRPVWEIP